MSPGITRYNGIILIDIPNGRDYVIEEKRGVSISVILPGRTGWTDTGN
jgi:hypothetical protein